MKLWEVFRFEFTYQIRRAWPWLILAVLLVLSFLLARDASLVDAMYEDFFANSSFAVAKTTVIGGLLWLLLAAAVTGEAAARDVRTGMHPLIYTAPISKAEYLGGRFLAALALNAPPTPSSRYQTPSSPRRSSLRWGRGAAVPWPATSAACFSSSWDSL
jgi:hypothetical protein